MLSKETKNAFGAMAPRDAASGTRRVRGGALYELASRVNHDCFPNVARFDNFDGALERDAFVTFQSEGHDRKEDASGSSSRIAPDELRLMALDRIPAGAEVTMSYLPVTEPLARRRGRLRHTFGFDCACARACLRRSGRNRTATASATSPRRRARWGAEFPETRTTRFSTRC